MAKVILSLDGGGIRGAATTQFLTRVEERLQADHGKSIRDYVDFYAGTSTGSIIALALATTRMSMAQINDLYNYDNAQKIFSENKGWFEIDGLNAPKFEGSGKTKVLKKNLGQARIGDVAKDKHVLAIAYAIEKRTPVVFKSTKETNLNLHSYQVADASSAAPTYFPTREVGLPPGQDEYWLIDGGVIANNPTMCAIAEAKRVWKDVSVSQMRVLSVGTGFMTRKINGPKSRKWGGLQWMTEGKIMEVLSDERIVDYQAITIIDSGNYIRVNAELRVRPWLPQPPDDAMDDVSRTNIKRLKALGDFWFVQYGESAVQLLLGTYQGPSLDRIDPDLGTPVEQS
ncbi:MAG: patatin-like phospholipase family protein [Desulfobulbaceae bacterium]|nr:patatin-like phospholipase family protein [Desulfobulbaceae bacterium]